jgi:uroporphyrinogen-III synthase
VQLARGAAKADDAAAAGIGTLWITRARPGAESTAAKAKALGLFAVIEPLLEVRPIEGVVVDTTGASAIVFTSANAVSAFAALSPERAIRVFAVGDATATAARTARFSAVLSAQGDVNSLAIALAGRRRELSGGVILYPSAAEPSQDLGAALAPVGLKVRQVAVYETAAAVPSASLIARLPEIDGVLLHSAKAARALAGLLKVVPAPHLTAFCLSRQVAGPLNRSELAAVKISPAPDEAALLGLILPPH